MNTSARGTPLSRNPCPTLPSLPYACAVSICRYPSSSAQRTASTHSRSFSTCQTPRPTSGISFPSASTRAFPSAVTTSMGMHLLSTDRNVPGRSAVSERDQQHAERLRGKQPAAARKASSTFWAEGARAGRTASGRARRGNQRRALPGRRHPRRRPEPQSGDSLAARYRWTCDSGPAAVGKLAVFSTWMPAFCSPLKGVMTGDVAPGSHPRLNGTLGSLNHTPKWYWWVGANVVVPPRDTEKVSESNTPRTVALPVPLLLAWMSLWYHEMPNGFAGCWMTNRSKPALAGMPVTVTVIVSLSDPVVMVAWPDALGKHAVMPVAGTSLNENDDVTWGAVEPAAVVTPAAAATATASRAARMASVPRGSADRRREWVRFMPIPPVFCGGPQGPPGMKRTRAWAWAERKPGTAGLASGGPPSPEHICCPPRWAPGTTQPAAGRSAP